MKKSKITSCLVAAALVIIAIVPVSFIKNRTDIKTDVIYFGDSIVAGWGNDKPIPDRLAEKTGYSVYNAGFGGMAMAQVPDEQFISDRYNSFNMATLSEAVYSNDFSLVAMAAGREGETVIDYWSSRGTGLSKIDLANVKYVIIEFGANDYLANTMLDNPEDPYDVSTFGGALRYSVMNIKDGMPNAIIIIESPIFNSVYVNADFLNENGNSVNDYVETERRIAGELNVCFWDAYSASGITAENYSAYLYDGLHTNADGDDLISSGMADFIKSLE